jgi:hypothetical protein
VALLQYLLGKRGARSHSEAPPRLNAQAISIWQHHDLSSRSWMQPTMERHADTEQQGVASEVLREPSRLPPETLMQIRSPGYASPVSNQQFGVPVSKAFSQDSLLFGARAGDNKLNAQTFPPLPLSSSSRPYVSSTIGYRPLRPSDLGTLQAMHEALFPIK